MRTALGLYLEAIERGASPAIIADWLNHIPAWQIRAGFTDFAPECQSRRELPVERRPGNALNVEIGAPLPRCIERKPEHWPKDASAIRWTASGGSALVFGACSASACPRARGANDAIR